MNKENELLLIQKAMEMRSFSYAPYSHYRVGAALLTADNEIFGGCNIENASYGATNCAERTAIFKAVSEGKKAFKAIAIIGGPDNLGDNVFSDYAYPCGVCRQVMQEFCEEDFVIIVAKSETDYMKYTLKELLPFGFGGMTGEV